MLDGCTVGIHAQTHVNSIYNLYHLINYVFSNIHYAVLCGYCDRIVLRSIVGASHASRRRHVFRNDARGPRREAVLPARGASALDFNDSRTRH